MNDSTVEIVDSKKRYAAGVLKYAQMGYWNADYQPTETDVLTLFRITPQDGADHLHVGTAVGKLEGDPMAVQGYYNVCREGTGRTISSSIESYVGTLGGVLSNAGSAINVQGEKRGLFRVV